MYSNAVKIAELNDYLNPSEECVLPLVKKDDKYEIKLNDKTPDLNRHTPSNFSNHTLKDDIYTTNKLKVASVDKNNKITVGLSDCLSCSGCLTSSDEILLKVDNYLNVVEKMKEVNTCVVSISPQTIFMFSSYYNVSAEEVLQRLTYLFKRLGAKFVFDIGLSELLALNLSKEEFISNYYTKQESNVTDALDYTKKESETRESFGTMSKKHRASKFPIISSHCPGWTLYAEKTVDQDLVDKISKVPSSQIIQGLLVKILCYTMNYYKKIYNLNYVKLFFSSLIGSFNPISINDYYNDNTNSETIDTGVNATTDTNRSNINKSNYNNSCNIINDIKINRRFNTDESTHTEDDKNKVYHICIVPCYDKKFEMIRTEYKINFNSLFINSVNNDNLNTENEKESVVDDILSTSDVQKILDYLNIKFSDLKKSNVNYLVDYTYYFNKFVGLAELNVDESNNFKNMRKNDEIYSNNSLRRLVRSSELYCQSGGFSEEIFKWASKKIFSKSINNIQFKQTINSDFKECVLYDSSNNVLMRFIIAYGFKNIKNIIKILKSNQNKTNTTATSGNSEISKRLDYIELMSCPGGCFNGAGQMISMNKEKENKIMKLVKKYIPIKYLKYFKYFKLNDQQDVKTMGSNSFENFIKETTYINTDNPICEYFTHIVKVLKVKCELKSIISTNKNINIKW